MKKLLTLTIALFALAGCAEKSALKTDFKNPPVEYRPMPFWHLNGHLTTDGIRRQITQARNLSHYGGMTVLPVSPGPHWHDGHICPGMTPEYLGPEYFDRYADMLEVSEELGTQIILYDDIDFPSGSAGGALARDYPQYTRKFMYKDETDVTGGKKIVKKYKFADNERLMALSALNTQTFETVDLGQMLKDGLLEWDAPEGDWKVMAFTYKHAVPGVHGHLVDYMDPEAVAQVIKMTYDRYDRFDKYFGNVVTKTFFDDVGFVHMENTWNPAIGDMFRAKTGKNPALYYPALYYDMGPETASARAVFYDARAELLAEGYVRQSAEWSAARGLKNMGHPPANYHPNSVVANGDILKYYRHVHIPLLDVIFYRGHGLDGYKQITSAADRDDKGIVGAELNGAFFENMDSLTLYRVGMECVARGVNFIVPHGLWYDTAPENIRIPPLISWDNPYWGEAVPNYSDFMSRSCVMMQEGRRVVDVALLWPIAAIQGESWIGRDEESGLLVANWLPDNVNHFQLSHTLTNDVRRDFTYVHPEDFVNGKLTVNGMDLVLNNAMNRQEYKVLVMPGGDVISAESLVAIKKYYDGGGKVVATAGLPTRSSEFGRDAEVRAIVNEIFGTVPAERKVVSNGNGGMFAFLPVSGAAELDRIFSEMGVDADVAFADVPEDKVGFVNYAHKVKEGRDIYYFCNTMEKPLSTSVTLRGKVRSPELWNPHSGGIAKITNVSYENGNTVVRLELPPCNSAFIVGKR